METGALTYDQQANAYAEVKLKFGLRHQQRDLLDASPLYDKIMQAAHAGQWTTVTALLHRAGIMEV